MPGNCLPEYQRCYEPLGSLGGSPLPLLFAGSPEAATGASCSHPIQDTHPLPPQNKTQQNKTSMKAEYNLGQTPGSDTRMVGGEEGHWLQPLSSVV